MSQLQTVVDSRYHLRSYGEVACRLCDVVSVSLSDLETGGGSLVLRTDVTKDTKQVVHLSISISAAYALLEEIKKYELPKEIAASNSPPINNPNCCDPSC